MGCGHRALGARLGPPGTPGTRVPRRVPGGRGIQGSRFTRSTPRPIPQGPSRAPGKGPAGHAPSRRPPCARPVPTGTAILWPADPRAAGPAAVPTRPAAAPAGLACGPAGLGPGPAVKGQRSVPFPAPLPDPTPRVVGRVVGNVQPKTSGRRLRGRAGSRHTAQGHTASPSGRPAAPSGTRNGPGAGDRRHRSRHRRPQGCGHAAGAPGPHRQAMGIGCGQRAAAATHGAPRARTTACRHPASGTRRAGWIVHSERREVPAQPAGNPTRRRQ